MPPTRSYCLLSISTTISEAPGYWHQAVIQILWGRYVSCRSLIRESLQLKEFSQQAARKLGSLLHLFWVAWPRSLHVHLRLPYAMLHQSKDSTLIQNTEPLLQFLYRQPNFNTFQTMHIYEAAYSETVQELPTQLSLANCCEQTSNSIAVQIHCLSVPSAHIANHAPPPSWWNNHFLSQEQTQKGIVKNAAECDGNSSACTKMYAQKCIAGWMELEYQYEDACLCALARLWRPQQPCTRPMPWWHLQHPHIVLRQSRTRSPQDCSPGPSSWRRYTRTTLTACFRAGQQLKAATLSPTSLAQTHLAVCPMASWT